METAKTICKIRAIYTPLQDRFCKYGDTFKKVAHNEANGMYVTRPHFDVENLCKCKTIIIIQ